MKDFLKKKDKKSINPMVAAVAGVAVGVGAAYAASEALKDKKTRKKVDNFVSDVKDRAMDAKDKATEYFESSKDEPEVKTAVKKVQKGRK